MARSKALCMDCMEYMRGIPDGYFDLAVVDPPYGGGAKTPDNVSGGKRLGGQIDAERTGGTWAKKYGKIICEWDIAPGPEYFTELFRVSKNQIIWGGNYFELPPTRCFLVWRKLTISDGFSMAGVEYAWTSYNKNAKIFDTPPQGKKTDKRFHPTQKPIALYAWIFDKYANEGDKILDTHLGSGSSRIAAWRSEKNLDFVGIEIDKGYYEAQEERFARMTAQQTLFAPVAEQITLKEETGC